MGVFMRHNGEHQHGEHQDEFAQVRNRVRVARRRWESDRNLNPAVLASKAACGLTLAHPGPTIRALVGHPGRPRNCPESEVAVPRIKSAAKAMRKSKAAHARNRTRRE